VLAVRVYPAYFTAFYEAVLQRPGASDAALVRHTDGALLIRYPEVANAPKKLPASSPLLRAAAGDAKQGIYTGISSIDSRQRLSAFVRLERFPLLVNYTMDRSIILGAWYEHLATFSVFALLAGLALVFTARMTLARAAREQESLRLLVAETERRQHAEARLQQAQKMEALGRLTGGVAHDFNNLLAAVLGGLELSAKHVEHPRAVRLLQMAKEAAQRGAVLTSHMLAFARKQDVKLQHVDPNALIQGMQEVLNRTTGGLVRARYNLTPGAWSIMADAVQLEVAILNLVLNARDAMPLGGHLTITTRNQASYEAVPQRDLKPGDYVVISVIDGGEGMPERIEELCQELRLAALSGLYGPIAQAAAKKKDVSYADFPGGGAARRTR
jgi:signal transduction histidine kinase